MLEKTTQRITFAMTTCIAGLGALTLPGCGVEDPAPIVSPANLRQNLLITLVRKHESGIYEVRCREPRFTFMYYPDGMTPAEQKLIKQLDKLSLIDNGRSFYALPVPLPASVTYKDEDLGWSYNSRTARVINIVFKEADVDQLLNAYEEEK